MRNPLRSGPVQRAVSRLAHALSLLWFISSAPAQFAATGPTPAALPDGGDSATGEGSAVKEAYDEDDS